MGVPVNVKALRDACTNAGLTQEQLAKRADCDVRTVARAKSLAGQPRIAISTLAAIANALDARVSDFLLPYPTPPGPQSPVAIGNTAAQRGTTTGSPPVGTSCMCLAQDRDKRTELRYHDNYHIGDVYIPYVRLHGSREKDTCEYSHRDLKLHLDDAKYELPAPLKKLECPHFPFDTRKVRLARYCVQQTGNGAATRLEASFSCGEVTYSDYCRVARNIDTPIAKGVATTYRDLFAPKEAVTKNSVPRDLPNVCGVGMFLIARGSDGRSREVIITRQTETQTVSAGLWTYSASGSMDWPKQGEPSPFDDVERETWEETHYRCNRENVRLIGLGIDSKELYVQFSFVETTDKLASDILCDANQAIHDYEWDDIQAIPFTCDAIVDALLMGPWEPAGAAALITIASKEFGEQMVAEALSKKVHQSRR